MPVEPLAERRLMASRADDPLNVHVVSEYLFCERASVLALESEEADPGLDLRTVRLGYLPRYDERRLEKWLGKATAGLLIGDGLLVSALALCGALAWAGYGWTLLVCWALLALLVGVSCAGLGLLFLLTWRLAAARGAKPTEPDFSGSETCDLGWWSLIAAGYELQQWPDSIMVERWRLSGRPWRVLVRGETAVPVLLSKRGDGRLQKNHFARIAAYCSLVAEQSGMESPFGVVLLAGTTDCVAIRHSAVSQQALADGVVGMRELARLVRTEPMFAKTPSATRCYSCPHGRLAPYREPPVPEGQPEPFLVQLGGKSFQSRCGLRFRWAPPHHSLRPR